MLLYMHTRSGRADGDSILALANDYNVNGARSQPMGGSARTPQAHAHFAPVMCRSAERSPSAMRRHVVWGPSPELFATH